MTSPDGFNAELVQLARSFVDQEQAKVAAAVRKGADVTKKQLVQTSPRDSGDYGGGWRRSSKLTFDHIEASVYQAKKPGLPHLLEKGHGGPHPAPAHPHIESAYEVGVATIESELGT
uniref:HK97 gp10 family phage protein n=1 Tax=uncultured bacterium Contig1770 TaxID=1393510 RepID=W0FLF5_9BACT|nr:hypothetical protein [uncultured bacterium Contig1770]